LRKEDLNRHRFIPYGKKRRVFGSNVPGFVPEGKALFAGPLSEQKRPLK
jgi:hypothetical protein